MLKIKLFPRHLINTFKSTFKNLQNFSTSSKNEIIQYTEPLDILQIKTVTPARKVPDHIQRPDYMVQKNFNYSRKAKSVLRSPEDLEKFRYANKVAAGAVKLGIDSVKEGMTTDDIDKIIHEYIISKDCYPSAIGYMGFPKSLCTSVNEVLCHGVPNQRKLNNGDYVNFDVTTFYKGLHGDTSGMALIGNVHPDVQKLMRVTREAMYKAINICKPGVKVKKIGETIEDYAREFNYTVSAEFAGHGIGQQMHMYPSIMHSREDNNVNDVMEEGMAFTIEPIILMHPYDQLYMWEDNWTVVCPNNPSAQWEHTILITKDGYEILTLREGEVPLLI
jgi:methionyl aminopeptidase